MAQQTIDIGAAANDGTGDPIRDAFDKTNDNFTELYAADAALGTAADVDLDTDGTLAANSDTVIASQKATKTYVDAKVAGLSWKQAVRAATTANGTLASAYENGDSIDGVTLATGDRILIKNQSTASENGIYSVNASGAPTRATDADSGAELVNATCYVSEGTTLADTQWTCSTNAPITVGSTGLTFVQLTSGGGSLGNAVTFNSSGGAAAGTSFDGSAAKTIDYSTVGAAKTGAATGSGLTMATARMLGRTTASTGAIEEITIGTGLLLSSGTLVNTGSSGLGTAWTLAGSGQTATGKWDQSVDGSKSAVDFTGLAGATDIMIVGWQTGQSVSGIPFMRVSVDNGSTWYSSTGNYVAVGPSGVTTNSTTSAGLVDTAATAGISWGAIILGANLAQQRLIQSTVRFTAGGAYFVASTSPINAVRLQSTGAGNFNSGQIYCFIR